MRVRAERPDDEVVVDALVRAAFGDDGDQVAGLLPALRRVRDTKGGASLIAEDADGVVGHVMCSRGLLDAPRALVEVQVLSPLAVRPDCQRQGVGAELVRAAIAAATALGAPLLFLEGSPSYYPRFGFEAAGALGFRKPSLRIPDAAFMVVRLPAYEPWMTGTLVYDQLFWEADAVGLREDDPRAHDAPIRPP